MPPKNLWHSLEGQNTKHYCTWTLRDRRHWSFSHQGANSDRLDILLAWRKTEYQRHSSTGSCSVVGVHEEVSTKGTRMFWNTTRRHMIYDYVCLDSQCHCRLRIALMSHCRKPATLLKWCFWPATAESMPPPQLMLLRERRSVGTMAKTITCYLVYNCSLLFERRVLYLSFL